MIGRHVQAGAQRAPDDLEVLGAVVHHDRHVVADAEAERPEQVRDLVGAGFELAVGQDVIGTGDDDRGPVGVRGGEAARVFHHHRV